MRAIAFTDEQKKQIQLVYETGCKSINQLSIELGVGRGAIKKVAKELGYDSPKRPTHAGIKFEWTDTLIDKLKEVYDSPFISVREFSKQLGVNKDVIIRKAKELGLNKVVKTNLTPDQLQAIESWNGEVSLSELAQQIGISQAAIWRRLQNMKKNTSLYIELNPEYSTKQKIEETPEFLDDLANPRYSSSDLAEKYDVSDVTIQKWRKKKFGKFKPQLDTSQRMTTLEKSIEKILKELDLAYFVHYKIGKWNVDFYLGQKGVIETHGSYWHGREKTIEKDDRKRKDLKAKGYRLLEIYDTDLDDQEKVKDTIYKFWVSLTRKGKKTTS